MEVKVARVSDITPGKGHVRQLEDVRVALFNIDGTLYCIEDVCSHDDGPLAEGELEGNVIQCPRHGARFNVATGAVLSMPAPTPVRTFRVKIEAGDVFVQLEPR